jgi:hypothetical protein
LTEKYNIKKSEFNFTFFIFLSLINVSEKLKMRIPEKKYRSGII